MLLEQTFLHRKNSWHQNSQKVLSCKHTILFWLLTFNKKAQRTNFCSPPIKLLKFALVQSAPKMLLESKIRNYAIIKLIVSPSLVLFYFVCQS
jgi:hypothetical protein